MYNRPICINEDGIPRNEHLEFVKMSGESMTDAIDTDGMLIIYETDKNLRFRNGWIIKVKSSEPHTIYYYIPENGGNEDSGDVPKQKQCKCKCKMN